MGQLPFDPPSVFGWPSGTGWISTSTILERYNFPLLIDPTEATALQNRKSVDDISRILFPEGLQSSVIEAIRESSNSLIRAADKLRDIVRLTMSSPFYNLN
jgi:uncharacterized protein (DUF1800 family)